MIPIELDELVRITHGTLHHAPTQPVTIQEVSTDSRKLTPGSLFIALVGETFDAHDFIAAAAEAGVAAALVQRVNPDVALPQIVVADTRIALGQLGGWVRKQLDLKVIAITGSCGKTTVKEMCAAILGQIAPVLATQGNLNNDIGVPQTLLRLTPDIHYAVVELGANHPGEIAWTVSLTKPDVAVVNNVSAAHLAGFGSVRGVAVAKTEIFGGLSEHGTAILNADSEFYNWWHEILTVKTRTFSVHNPDASFHALNITQDEQGYASFDMVTPLGTVPITLPLPGVHNVSNALSAAALTASIGATLEQIKQGLEQVKPVKGRFCVEHLRAGLTLIDDTYNASVQSVKSAIDTLSVMPGYKVLAFGDMGELGDDAVILHREIGIHAHQKGIDAVLTVGKLAKHTAEAGKGQHFSDKQGLCEVLRSLIQQQQPITILAKGARSSRMEDIVAFVKSSEEKAC